MFLRARPKVEKKRKERKKGEGGSWNACFHILTYLKKHFFPVSLQRKLKMSYVRGEGGEGGGGGGGFVTTLILDYIIIRTTRHQNKS